jgi:hypothetical protein
MKFRPAIFGFVFWGLVSLDSYSQQKLSKEEILNEYRTKLTIPNLDSIFRWDVHLMTRATLDGLLTRKVDTLVIYSVNHHGYAYLAKNDTCSTILSNSYFFWRERGKYLFLATDSRCKSRHAFADGKIVRFAVDNFSRIKKEFFMSAVSGAERNGDNVRVSESWVDHEPKYSILVFVNGQHNYLTFTENGLTNKNSLFVAYNKSLTSFQLFKLIEKELRND